MGAGNSKLASSFIPKCTGLSIDDRCEMWTKCGLVVKAAEEAFKVKDVGRLENLRKKASANAANEIDRMINIVRPRS